MRIGSTFLQQVTQAAAALLPSPLCQPLRAAQAELRRSLHLAFRLASIHHRVVVLEPHRQAAEGRISVRLPEGVRWGRPTAIPLPPSLADSGWRGGEPYPITVMPQRRASANVWFLHHGQEALCLHLDLSGSVQLLRYRPRLGAWTSC
jgi:trehalose utilization protein